MLKRVRYDNYNYYTTIIILYYVYVSIITSLLYANGSFFVVRIWVIISNYVDMFVVLIIVLSELLLLLMCAFYCLYCSCDFEGTKEELVIHLEQCKFEGLKVCFVLITVDVLSLSLKGYLTRTDENISHLQAEIKQKDEEISFLRSMLASLSEKVEYLEKATVGKIGELAISVSHSVYPST